MGVFLFRCLIESEKLNLRRCYLRIPVWISKGLFSDRIVILLVVAKFLKTKIASIPRVGKKNNNNKINH